MMNSGSEMTASEETEIAWSAGRPCPDGREDAEHERERDHEERRDRRQDEGVDDLRADLAPRSATRPPPRSRPPSCRDRPSGGRRASRSSARRRGGRGPSPPRISASCSGDAVRPRTALAASPGSTSVPTKIEDRDDEERRDARRQAAQDEAEQRPAPPGGRRRPRGAARSVIDAVTGLGGRIVPRSRSR